MRVRLVDGLVEAQVARGSADADGALAAGGYATSDLWWTSTASWRGLNVQRDGFGFAGSEMDAVECDQGADRELHAFGNFAGSAEVDLRDFVGGHAAGVLDVDA